MKYLLLNLNLPMALFLVFGASTLILLLAARPLIYVRVRSRNHFKRDDARTEEHKQHDAKLNCKECNAHGKIRTHEEGVAFGPDQPYVTFLSFLVYVAIALIAFWGRRFYSWEPFSMITTEEPATIAIHAGSSGLNNRTDPVRQVRHKLHIYEMTRN